MTRNFDFHDTISVVIPGACAVILLLFFCCSNWGQFVHHLSALTVGSSLVFLTSSYAVGELLQALGKLMVKHGGCFAHQEAPYTKVLLQNKHPENYKNFLTMEECRLVQTALSEHFGWAHISEGQLYSCFYHIKIKVYSHDMYRAECIKMLTKLHFFSTMMALSILAPVMYVAVALSFAPHFSLWEFLSIFLLSSIIGYGCSKSREDFDNNYNRCLFSSYLAIVEAEKQQS